MQFRGSRTNQDTSTLSERHRKKIEIQIGFDVGKHNITKNTYFLEGD